MSLDSPTMPTLCALVRFAMYSDEVHTGTPRFKFLDPPLLSQTVQKKWCIHKVRDKIVMTNSVLDCSDL